MNLAAPKTILRTYVFARQTVIDSSAMDPGESRDVHFFLDIQINPPYKGDTSACSSEWRVLWCKGRITRWNSQPRRKRPRRRKLLL